jgi:DNA polymerase-3 subunit gamma/tau
MSYEALARKYRPATFAEVVGQQHVTGTLRAAIRKGKLSHAYVFAGPRGCGKTTVARLLAKALNCRDRQDGDPCGVCPACVGIAHGSYLDVLEIDAASHTGVDNVRELREMAQYTPTDGGCRVFIVDEVHMLSKGAFNALLKILEEPPPSVYFFFATTEPNKIPRTILSRCQRFDFRLLTPAELAGRLREIAAAEQVALQESGLGQLVSLAEGSLRDGLSLLDQAIAGCEGDIDEEAVVALFGLVRSESYHEFNEAMIAGDAARALALVDQLVTEGHSLSAFAHGLVANFRNLLVLKIDPELAPLVDVTDAQRETLQRQCERFTEQDLLALIDRAGQHFERIHRSGQPRILMEAAAVELVRFESRVLLSDLARRLGELMRQPGGPAPGGTSTAAADASPGADADGSAGVQQSAATHQDAATESSGTERAGAHGGRESAGVAVHGAGAQTVAGWAGFITALMSSHPRVAACLLEALPSLDEARNRLVIAFPEDKVFQMNNLAADRELITEAAAAHWGRSLKLEFVTGSEPADRPARDELRRRVAPTSAESLAAACRTDRALHDLVELMRGEPLAESERERWARPVSGAKEPAPEREPGEA